MAIFSRNNVLEIDVAAGETYRSERLSIETVIGLSYQIQLAAIDPNAVINIEVTNKRRIGNEPEIDSDWVNPGTLSFPLIAGDNNDIFIIENSYYSYIRVVLDNTSGAGAVTGSIYYSSKGA